MKDVLFTFPSYKKEGKNKHFYNFIFPSVSLSRTMVPWYLVPEKPLIFPYLANRYFQISFRDLYQYFQISFQDFYRDFQILFQDQPNSEGPDPLALCTAAGKRELANGAKSSFFQFFLEMPRLYDMTCKTTFHQICSVLMGNKRLK